MKTGKTILGRSFVVAALFIAAPVWADEPAKQQSLAQLLYDEGKEAAKAEQWQKAEIAFEGAMKHEPSPKTAGQLGRVQVERGKYVEGAKNLEWFFQEDTEVLPEVKDAVRPTLTLAKKNLATVRLKIDAPGAIVRIDGIVVESNRLAWPQYLKAGPHVFEASKEGFVTETRNHDLVVGRDVVVELPLKVVPATQEGPSVGGPIQKGASKPMPMPVKAAWVVSSVFGGIAIGTGIGAIVTYVPMEKAWNDNGCGHGCRAQYETRQTLLEGLSTTAVVSGVLWATVFGYAIYGTVTNRKDHVGVSLVPTMNGAMLVGNW